MGKKIGRNDPCPCGSGKKYKLCCINKMSEEEIQALYLEQFELTKGLNEANKCHKILDIGKRIIERKYVIICTLPLKKTCRPSGGTFYFFFLVRNPSGNSFDHGKSRFRSSGFGKGPILRSSSNT